MEKETGGVRKLRKEELHDVYSPNIIRVIRSRMMGRAERVARLGEEPKCLLAFGL
jgi:hypothetical protein